MYRGKYPLVSRRWRNVRRAPLVLVIRFPLALLCLFVIIPLSRQMEHFAHWLLDALPGFER